MDSLTNLILDALPAPVIAALQPHLKVAAFKQGAVIAETGAPITTVYFPHSGIISLVVELEVGSMIETAMVGFDGVVNAAGALDGRVSLNKGIVQLDMTASVIPVEKLVDVANEHRDFRALLIRHEQVMFAQAQQSAACNASHQVEARMSRWLLRTRDLARKDELRITQEFLAQMLGVHRNAVSVVANTLQKAGSISYKHGQVKILDADSLRASSCECYDAVKKYYGRLLQPLDGV